MCLSNIPISMSSQCQIKLKTLRGVHGFGWMAGPSPWVSHVPRARASCGLEPLPGPQATGNEAGCTGGKDVERKKAIILHLMLGMEILITAKLSSSCINSHFLTESSSLGLVSVAADVQPYLPSDIIISYSSVGFPH